MPVKYVCQQCGADSPKWQGKCYNCGAWNSLVETTVAKGKSKSSPLPISDNQLVRLQEVQGQNLPRLTTGLTEVDRVLGGGLVPGSVILVGGEPGIGKSTLLLQLLIHTGGIYVSAEESAHQVKLRAERLGIADQDIKLLASDNVDQAIALIDGTSPKPPLVIIDSIQTITTPDLDGVAGSIGQVRESAHRLVNLAKRQHIPLIIVSHVTKEGTIAGPKVLEHVVDAVLYLEGEEFSMFRLLRGVKNRFGAINEVGLFELSEQGMAEVLDASQLLIPDHPPTPGSAITVTMEGIRPMILEIQALTAPTAFGLPRRTANGMDYNRLLMLIAALTKHTSVSLGNQDVYTNVAGGLKIRETGIDLAVCLALASSALNRPLPSQTVALGEVSLAGEIKPVLGQKRRLEQASKLGFNHSFSSDNVHNLKQALASAFPKK